MGSAANRIAITAFLAYAGATLLLGIAIFYAMHTAFARQIDARIAQTAASLAAEFQDDGAKGVVEALRERRGGGPDRLSFALFDAAGRAVAGDLVVARPAPGWQTISFFDPAEGPDPARALVVQLGGGYRLVVAEDLSPLEEIDQTILGLFAIAFAAFLAAGIGGALLLARYLKARLGAIGATADAIIAGDFERRATVGARHDEFDRAAASLNAMLDRIAQLIANLRQVTADLAHDLRTPLSRLRNQLERLHTVRDSAQRHAAIDAALGQADEVLALFDAILRISEVEEGSLRKAFGPVDLSALAIDLGETLGPLIEDSRRTLEIAAEPGVTVQGDRELLAQAGINLIENARRHTPEGATIRLDLRRCEGAIVLAVCDDGPGIPAPDRERVQQRFVRLDAARSTPGHGLGLSLVRAIAGAHGAELVLADADPGLAVSLVFPACPPAQGRHSGVGLLVKAMAASSAESS